MPAPSRTRSSAAGTAVWLWPGRALYAGPSLRLGPHSGAVACLAVGVDAPFAVRPATGGELRARTALIAPRVRHRLVMSGDRMVFLYLEPGSADDRACRTGFTAAEGEILAGHRREDALLARAAELSPHTPLPQVTAWIAEATGHAGTSYADPRIAAAARRLIEASRPLPAAPLAAELGLSESRFLRLFRDGTGTSYRRFRLWAQMHRAARALAAGHNLTRAAADGYFASPSHLSTAFHAMFGLTPSALLSRNPVIHCLDPSSDAVT
ncbi:helix-turn-helix domain-containing protein [Planobispora siamensis]|uniref:Transcriptional regulator n=1 Tax=Planobispora siamensis TaxID=936338 RepID=A0A8J3SIX3_9ACTN|nr:AraC family transcriptional regulator [Planobispora siamensis]GIH95137.1 transcriptional regulator [Planobispora siamensis]